MEDKKRYREALEGLNPKQREAVVSIEGPVMVIAGPGTGKTQILSMRIAYIMAETDTPADSILALTFTESGAMSIRKRLLGLVGKDSYDVSVHTFHGFANSMIQTYPDYFPKIIGGRQCEPIEQIEMVQNIIDSSSFDHIKPFGNPFFYVRPIISAIQDLKKEGFTPERFEELIKEQVKSFKQIEDLYHEKGRYKGQMKGAYAAIEKKIQKNHELLQVYKEYENEKSNRGLYDYDDMILEVLGALESDKEFLLMLQERYLYILADEHQDSNRSQNRLLELLSSFHENPNIFVVGDDKQAIYRFQGASLENFLYFKKHYPSAHIIDLKENYRSTQHILDISSELISNNPTISDENLLARSSAETIETEVIPAKTPTAEALCVAKRIKELISEGEDPSEIAILFRKNRYAENIREALVQQEIEYSLYGTAAETPHIVTEQFLELLRVIVDPTDEAKLSQILFYSFFNLDPNDIFETFRLRKERKITLLELAKQEPESSVSKVISLIVDLHKDSENSTLRNFFNKVIRGTGIIEDTLKDPDSARAVSELQSLLKLAKTLESPGSNIRLNEYLSQIERAREYGLAIFSGSDHKRSGVQLMTVHRSKGLEFNSVFIVGLTDSNWGGRKNPEYFYLPELKSLKINEAEKAKEDERRLFYVALTRAKQKLVITYPLENSDGREEIESQFLSELGGKTKTSEICEDEPEMELGGIAKLGSILDKEIVSSYFFRRGLNATAINKYLRCSWEYFFTSLVQIPQDYSTSAFFGTAMHSALQRYFDAHNKDEKDPELKAREALRNKLFNGELEEGEAERFFERGSTSLDGYFKNYSDLPKVKSELEKTVRVDLETAAGSVKLTGNLDRVIREEGGNYIVTDFKTGKPKSRNELEGKTKNSDGNYKRQLIFYSLLLEESGKRMQEGIVDFVEPNERGFYKQERFSITDEERLELKNTINSIATEILSLSFTEKGCEEKTCEWCRLAGFLER